MKAIVQLSVYGGALVSLMLPFYDFECHCFFPSDSGDKFTNMEGKQYIGSMNRAQQAYFIENEEFTTDLEKLLLGIQSETESYSYQIIEPMVPVQSQGYPILAPPRDRIFMVAQSKDPLKKPSYLGAVFILPDKMTQAQICQTEFGHPTLSQLPRLAGEKIVCPPGTSELKR